MNSSELGESVLASANATAPFERSPADKFVAVFGIFLLIFGSVGNVLTMVVIWAYKSMRPTTRLLFFLLAFADEVTLVLAELRYWTLATFQRDLRDFNSPTCSVHTFFTTTFVGLSVWVLCIISLERLCLTWFPTKSHPFARMRSVVLIVIFIVIFNMAQNVFYLSRAYDDNGCGEITIGHKKAVPIVGYVLGYFLPFLVMLIATVLLLWKVLRQKRQVGARDSSSSSLSRNRLKTTTIMLVAIVLAQLVLGTPGYVFSILIDLGLLEHFNKRHQSTVYTTLLSLMVMNNASNFYIYVFSARGFRQAFLDLFRSVGRSCSKRP